MADWEDFIQKFHSLEGVTLNERKKNFYSLLKAISSSESLNTIVQMLTPTTYLEETFKIELLIHFKRTNDLLVTLQNGNEIAACKIIRQNWFIKELMNKYSPKDFVNEIVSKLSFSIRLKIFKRIYMNVKNEIVIEEFFDGIFNVYGISSAKVFLLGCTNDKIVFTLQNFFINFSASQLKLLFQKEKYLIVKYFEIMKKNCFDVDCYKWKSFFLYIGRIDPLFYLEICEKFGIDKYKLGRQSTKKYFNIKREQIILKPSDYVKFLRKDVLVRKLGTEFPLFYKNLLPENLIDFRFFPGKSMLKYFPKKKQYDLYLNTFAEVYNQSLWNNVEYMDQKLIELIPEKEEREKWILKFENRQNIKKYLRKKKCAMFFVENEETNVIKEKKTIFNTLISSCKLTKDYNAFLNILKSFCERHINSDVTIIYNFLRTVYKELDLHQFNNNHWQYIYDIIEIQLFKKQQIFHPMFLEYIKVEYLHKNPIDDHVLTLLNEAPLDLSKFSYNNKDFEKNMHLIYLKLLPEVSNKKNEIAIQVALSLIKWNEKFPLEAIKFSNQNDIMNTIKTLPAGKINENYKRVFKYLVYDHKNEMNSDFDNIYWTNYDKLNDDSITNWFIKYKPTTFKSHINKIGIILKNKNLHFIHRLKKYSHLTIPQNITALCLEELKISVPSKCGRLVKILIRFMEQSELESYMVQYVPKIDAEMGDDDQKILAIQCALAKYSKLTQNLSKFLPILLKYCRGNVLHSALASLYSSFHRIPQNQLYPALKELEKGPVSVKKHTIFLTCLVLPKDDVISKYEQVQISEHNSSLKQHMFTSCFKYFIKNETPECWTIIQCYLKQLAKGNKDILKMLTKVRLIPIRYRSNYTEMVWNILVKFKTDKELIDEYMFTLLNSLYVNDISHLNVNLCSEIIENNLFDFEQCSMDKTVSTFIRTFLLCSKKDEQKVEKLVQVIRVLKEHNSGEEEQMKCLDLVYEFCFRLLTDVISSRHIENIDTQFIKSFKKALMEIFSMEEIFEELLILDLIVFMIESPDYKKTLPGRMSVLFLESVQKFGYLILNRFKGIVGKILDTLFPYNDFELLLFLNSFLEEHCTLEHCALVVDLMPYISNVTDTKSTRNAYDGLLKKLKSKGLIIMIRLNGKLKNI